MNILLAFDTFKGSADAIQITQRLEKRIKDDFPAVNVKSLPIADGGEGSISAIENFLNCKRVMCSVHNALMEKMDAYYLVCPDGTAIIEMASASGFAADRRR
jgi:Glycerate kinase